MKNKLNAKQRLFVAEYIKTHNATQSCINAGYSKKTAHSAGPRLLENVGIKAEIEKTLVKVEEKAIVTAAEVLTELKRIGFVDIRGAFEEDGSLKPLSQIPEDVARCLSGIDISDERVYTDGDSTPTTIRIKKIKMLDKIKALELLGKSLAMFTDKVEVGMSDALAERLARAEQRSEK
jgi:phage terminase small subunit